jgi:hypothetical protein
MELTAIVTVLALLQFIFFGIQVGSRRVKLGIKAPLTEGTPEFDRMFRVHYNTMEQLVAFLPALWLYGVMVNHLWGAAMGVVYLVGRFIYRSEYVKEPDSRSLGFGLTVLPTAVMLVWVLVVAVLNLF